jgi:MFS family permease
MRPMLAALMALPAFRIALTGAGFFADSYDLFVTEGVTSILKNLGPVVAVNYTYADNGASRSVVSYFTAACTDGVRCMPRVFADGRWVANPATTFRPEMTPVYQQQTSAGKSAVNTAALVGSVLGQLFFGFAGDLLGRKLNWVITAALIIVGSLGHRHPFVRSSRFVTRRRRSLPPLTHRHRLGSLSPSNCHTRTHSSRH